MTIKYPAQARWYHKNKAQVRANARRAYAQQTPAEKRLLRYQRVFKWAREVASRVAALYETVAECGVCGAPNGGDHKGWRTDHCHESGFFRGFLCFRCNSRLDMNSLADRWLLSPREMAYLSVSDCGHCRGVYG